MEPGRRPFKYFAEWQKHTNKIIDDTYDQASKILTAAGGTPPPPARVSGFCRVAMDLCFTPIIDAQLPPQRKLRGYDPAALGRWDPDTFNVDLPPARIINAYFHPSKSGNECVLTKLEVGLEDWGTRTEGDGTSPTESSAQAAGATHRARTSSSRAPSLSTESSGSTVSTRGSVGTPQSPTSAVNSPERSRQAHPVGNVKGETART